MRWPAHAGFGRHGYVITRFDLDALVSVAAPRKRGRSSSRVVKRSRPSGRMPVLVGRRSARWCATGTRANKPRSPPGSSSWPTGRTRALGAPSEPSGTSRCRRGWRCRGYYASPRHAEHWIESHLDLHDPEGASIPGYGWIFPLGDGRVNVGVGVLSTEKRLKGLNTTRLMEAFVAMAPASWGLEAKTALSEPTGGRLPMGLSVTPRHGPDYVLCGDSSGSINPFNGEGISYGYETGRIAAAYVAEAIASNDLRVLEAYERKLQENYGLYYKAASASMRFLGQPDVIRVLVATGMHSRSLMEWLLRIMSNQLRTDELVPAEIAYRAIEQIAMNAA